MTPAIVIDDPVDVVSAPCRDVFQWILFAPVTNGDLSPIEFHPDPEDLYSSAVLFPEIKSVNRYLFEATVELGGKLVTHLIPM